MMVNKEEGEILSSYYEQINNKQSTYYISNPILESELLKEFNLKYPFHKNNHNLFNSFLELKLSYFSQHSSLKQNNSSHTQKPKPVKLRKLEKIARRLSERSNTHINTVELEKILKSVIESGDKRTISSWLDLVTNQMIELDDKHGYKIYFVGEFIPKYFPDGNSMTYDEYLIAMSKQDTH
jgi:hypothetical protein